MNILALDQGTTSSRAIIFNEKLSVISKYSYPLTQHYPSPGWVEHDAEKIFDTQMKAADNAVMKSNKSIDAIGITNQRETVVVWNKYTGKPVCKAIVWQCRRTADICENLVANGYSDLVKEKTGLTIDAYFSATKIKWILENVKDAASAAERGELLCGTIDSWLIWKLTGVHVTDITNASRTMLFDIKTKCWSEELCSLFSIPLSMLPEVVENCGIIANVKSAGNIPESLWGVPICSSVGDQQAALFGQACFGVGDVKNTYGTGCFTLMNIGNTPIYDNNLVTTIGWSINNQTVYALEGSVFNAGSSIQWLRDELKIISEASECDRLAESVDDSAGVTFVSAFTGLGAPYWDMHSRGTLVGLTRGSGRAHICRAVLEGIAFQVNDLVHSMELGSKCKIHRLKVDGGASVSDFMMQFQADLLNVPVIRSANVESTALGAAMLAYMGLTKCDLNEICSNIVVDKTYIPTCSDSVRQKNLSRWEKAVKAARTFYTT